MTPLDTSITMNGGIPFDDGPSLADVAHDVTLLRGEVRKVGAAQEYMAREMRAIRGTQARASRWGAFMGALLATAVSVGVQQCDPVGLVFPGAGVGIQR